MKGVKLLVSELLDGVVLCARAPLGHRYVVMGCPTIYLERIGLRRAYGSPGCRGGGAGR